MPIRKPYELTGNEYDPTGRSVKEPGAKMDGSKMQAGILEEVFPRALEQVALVADFGARKYSRGGCLQVPNGRERYKDAEWRHRLARAKGEMRDPETKLLHEAHECWNKLIQLELLLREAEEGGLVAATSTSAPLFPRTSSKETLAEAGPLKTGPGGA